MGKRKKPQHKLGEMNRADWKEIRETIANQPAPPNPPPNTETAKITAEVPVGDVAPETPTPPAMEVKAEISVTTSSNKGAKAKAKKKATKKKPATPKAAKKKTTKKSKPAEAPATAPDTKKDEVKEEAAKETHLSPDGTSDTAREMSLPTRPKKLSAKKQRESERPWEKSQSPLPHHTLESVGLRRPKPKKTVKKKGSNNGGNGDTANDSRSGDNEGSRNWLPIIIVILGAILLLLTAAFIAERGGVSFSIHQFTQQCCDDDEIIEVNVEANCPAVVVEEKPDSAKAEVVRRPQRRSQPEPRPVHTCDADTVIVRDTMYVRDGKDS